MMNHIFTLALVCGTISIVFSFKLSQPNGRSSILNTHHILPSPIIATTCNLKVANHYGSAERLPELKCQTGVRTRVRDMSIYAGNAFDPEDDDEDEEISIEEAFKVLAKGKKTVSFEAIIEWDVVKELIEEEVITTEELKNLFFEAGASKKTLSGNIEVFDQFLELLGPYAEGDDEDEDGESRGHTDDNDDEDDGEVVEDIFKRLAGGKASISMKNLMTWDVIQELINEKTLNAESLNNYFKECGGNLKSGIDFKGFEMLVDILAEMYGEEEMEEDSDSDIQNVMKLSDNVDGSDDDDEDYIDIDTDEVFQELSKGKEHIDLSDLMSWSLIKDMINAGELDKKELLDIIETAGVENVKKIDIIAFEAILDEMSFRAEADQDDGVDLEPEN